MAQLFKRLGVSVSTSAVILMLAVTWSLPSTGRAACVGDCNGSGTVTIDELMIGVSIALETVPPSACMEFDPAGHGRVGVGELIVAVGNVLDGCPLTSGASDLQRDT